MSTLKLLLPRLPQGYKRYYFECHPCGELVHRDLPEKAKVTPLSCHGPLSPMTKRDFYKALRNMQDSYRQDYSHAV